MSEAVTLNNHMDGEVIGSGIFSDNCSRCYSGDRFVCFPQKRIALLRGAFDRVQQKPIRFFAEKFVPTDEG